VKGDIFFHPSDQDPSPGTPVMKKPLECVFSVYSNSETAVAAKTFDRQAKASNIPIRNASSHIFPIPHKLIKSSRILRKFSSCHS